MRLCRKRNLPSNCLSESSLRNRKIYSYPAFLGRLLSRKRHFLKNPRHRLRIQCVHLYQVEKAISKMNPLFRFVIPDAEKNLFCQNYRNFIPLRVHSV